MQAIHVIASGRHLPSLDTLQIPSGPELICFASIKMGFTNQYMEKTTKHVLFRRFHSLPTLKHSDLDPRELPPVLNFNPSTSAKLF